MVPSVTAVVLLAAATWTAYFLVAWLVSEAVRPRPVKPAPPTPDLPPDPPPAVVNYLVHGCRTDAHAPPATLVDLAARRYIELFQPGTDPEQILIRVRERTPHGLAPYERRVLDRVVETAGPDGAVSLADLSLRYAARATVRAAPTGLRRTRVRRRRRHDRPPATVDSRTAGTGWRLQGGRRRPANRPPLVPVRTHDHRPAALADGHQEAPETGYPEGSVNRAASRGSRWRTSAAL